MKYLLIVGAGGHARPIIATFKEQSQWMLSGVIDLDFSGEQEAILDVPVIGGLEVFNVYDSSVVAVFIAIGDNAKRKELFFSLMRQGYELPVLIHSTAYVSKSAQFGAGTYVGPFAHVGPNVRLGEGTIVNTLANLEHEVSVGEFSQIAPNAVLCGRCCIGCEVFVGANATVIEQVSVADRTVIGAGSVIIKDIVLPNQKIVGVPGRRI